MREIIQKMAGENIKSRNKQQNKKNDRITQIKKLSGLNEDFSGEKKIYINKPKDVEKFYHALVKAFEDEGETLNTIKGIFKKVIY